MTGFPLTGCAVIELVILEFRGVRAPMRSNRRGSGARLLLRLKNQTTIVLIKAI